MGSYTSCNYLPNHLANYTVSGRHTNMSTQVSYKALKCGCCEETVAFYNTHTSLLDAYVFCPACMHHLHTILTRVLPFEQCGWVLKDGVQFDSFKISHELMQNANQPNGKMVDYNSPYLSKLRDHVEGLVAGGTVAPTKPKFNIKK